MKPTFTQAVAKLLLASSGNDPDRTALHGVVGRTVDGRSTLIATDGAVLVRVTCPAATLASPPPSVESWLPPNELHLVTRGGAMHWTRLSHEYPPYECVLNTEVPPPGEWYGDPRRLGQLMKGIAAAWASVRGREVPGVQLMPSVDAHAPVRVVCHIDAATTIEALLMPMRRAP